MQHPRLHGNDDWLVMETASLWQSGSWCVFSGKNMEPGEDTNRFTAWTYLCLPSLILPQYKWLSFQMVRGAVWFGDESPILSCTARRFSDGNDQQNHCEDGSSVPYRCSEVLDQTHITEKGGESKWEPEYRTNSVISKRIMVSLAISLLLDKLMKVESILPKRWEAFVNSCGRTFLEITHKVILCSL